MTLRLFHFRRLGTRLAVLYAGLLAAAMLGMSLTLLLIAERSATDQVRRELAASGTVFDRLWSQRAAQLGGAAGLLARDFGFRAAVATGDKATIVSALDNLKARMGVPVAFVVGVDGNVTGLEPKLAGQAASLWDALDGGQMSGVIDLGGSARHVIAAPVMTPQLTGWVVFATDLDVREMQGLQRLSAIPIRAAVFQRRGDGRWVDPSDREAGALSGFIDRAVKDRTVSDLTTPTGNALALVKPLPVMAGSPQAVLLLRYPLDQALAGYHRLQFAILLAGLLGLLGTVLATVRMARSITRPVRLLDAAAARLAAGNEARVPVEGHDELARLAASFNRMATDIAERERRITHLAFNDTLTGLPNRAHFLEHLEHDLKLAERNGERVAVMILDLDDFKSVNDTLGHPVGDEVLRHVAARIDADLAQSFVARLGGDEFVIVSRQGDDGEPPLDRLAKRAGDAAAERMHIDGHDVTQTASIGIAISPHDGEDARALLKHADLALYRAKELGRGMFCFFEEALNRRAQERRRMEADLRTALHDGQFELHFQPLFDLDANRIGSFEALLRWHHPERGMIPPVEFIPVAEDTGLIVEIGAWVLREACARAATWPEHIRIAVNVSSVQFRRAGLSETVMQALAASGLAPGRLELEITESIFLEGLDETTRMLHGLRALGVKIALDDFGTGYSSLSYLQSFPFDKIKIDQSFIRDLLTRPGAVAIVRAITDLARALGMETTAEGVEENDQLAELRKHGCSSVQGYLFSRPIDAAAVTALLADEQRAAA